MTSTKRDGAWPRAARAASTPYRVDPPLSAPVLRGGALLSLQKRPHALESCQARGALAIKRSSRGALGALGPSECRSAEAQPECRFESRRANRHRCGGK